MIESGDARSLLSVCFSVLGICWLDLELKLTGIATAVCFQVLKKHLFAIVDVSFQ